MASLAEFVALKNQVYGMLGGVESQLDRLKEARNQYSQILTYDYSSVRQTFSGIYNDLDPDCNGYDWEGKRIIEVDEIFSDEIDYYYKKLSVAYEDVVAQLDARIALLEGKAKQLKEERAYYEEMIAKKQEEESNKKKERKKGKKNEQNNSDE